MVKPEKNHARDVWRPRTAFSAVGTEAFRRRFSGLAERHEAAIRHLFCAKSSRHSAGSWIDSAWSVLYLFGTSFEDGAEIASQAGMELYECGSLVARALDIHELRQDRGRKAARFQMKSGTGQKRKMAWPQRPHSKDVESLRKLELILAQLIAADPEQTRAVLHYYVNNAWRTETFLLFRDPALPGDALRYLQFLQALGIGKEKLRFIFFDASLSSSARRKWKESLGLTWRHRSLLEFRKPPYKASPASKRWLAIEPNFAPAHSRNARAFRFFMVMAAIAFGYEPAKAA